MVDHKSKSDGDSEKHRSSIDHVNDNSGDMAENLLETKYACEFSLINEPTTSGLCTDYQ